MSEQTSFLIAPEVLISTMTVETGHRHLSLGSTMPDALQGKGIALCGAHRQDNRGGGYFSDLVRSAQCKRCVDLANQMGPHPEQAEGKRQALHARLVERLKEKVA